MKKATGTITKMNGRFAATLPEAQYLISNPGQVVRLNLYVGDNAEFEYHPQDQFAALVVKEYHESKISN